MGRISHFAYGVISYLIFFATFLYAIGFLGDFIVPRTVDTGPETGALMALAINVALLVVFAIQHSGMARPEFKRVWARVVPEPVERSTYVLLSSLAMILLFWQWRPIAGVVWQVESSVAEMALRALYLGGWALLLYATFLIDHFELFGLKQVWRHLRGRTAGPIHFSTPSLYGWVRHPIYVAWLVITWATPTMTIGHLLYGIVVTGYIVAAVQLEERDLIGTFGETYRRYRQTTPAFIPSLRSAESQEGATATR